MAKPRITNIKCYLAPTLALLGSASCQALDLSASWPPASRGIELIEVSTDSLLSQKAAALRFGNYELSSGELQSFDGWYSRRGTPELRLSWLVPMSPNWGVILGLSKGESGTKYRIAPGLKLGWAYEQALTSRSRFFVKTTTTLGGRLTESPCTADYGDIGGVQTVNCRLAASLMPPKETLNYLMNTPPPDRYKITVSYQFLF